MQNPTIRYYPTGNGDMTLIVLSDGTTILTDCKFRDPDSNGSAGKTYDVKADLLEQLRKEDGVPHLDAFILTHPDKDHCQGFEKHFFQGKPDDYSNSDKDEERIVIDELWFAPRIFAPHETELCPDAEAFKKEANRRKELHQKKNDSRNEPGNQLRCVGYSANGSLEGLDDILAIPGDSTSRIANGDRTDFQLFLLAPVKKDTDDPDAGRNDTSIAFAAEFLDGENVANRVLFFGDAGCGILERIYDQNKDTENEHLVYDLLQTPHHCSWYTFSDCSYEQDKTASNKVIDLLERKREGAQIIASSKPVKDNDDDPPSYPAKQEYVGIVGRDNFLCTGEYPTADEPKPLIFSLTENGPRRDDPPKGNQGNTMKKALSTTGSKPRTYG